MKKILSIIFIITLTASFLSSCKKENIADGPPSISDITSLANRSEVLTSGTYTQWVLIRGNNLGSTYKVDFNGVAAADSLVWANDSTVTVKIPGPLPGNSASTPVTVYTKYGEVTYNFNIVPPPPVITSFTPASGAEGDEVTITGDWISNLVSVKFGSVNATVISNSINEIKVKVPTGGEQGFITVTTTGGSTQSANAFGFKYILYDDAFNAEWWVGGGWGGTADYANTTTVKRGTKSIKITYQGGWGSPLQVGGNFNTSGYTAIKISIYGGAGTNNNKVKMILSQQASQGVEIVLKEGAWTEYTIPLSQFGNPAIIDQIWLQEFSGVDGVIYVDDFGLI